MSSYYENVDKINEDTEKNDRLNDIIIKAYFVVCGIYLIPCIIQAIFFVDIWAVLDLIILALVMFLGYLSCITRNSKWCIVIALAMIFSLGSGLDNDTFIDKIMHNIGWHDFEINGFLFVPVTLLVLLTLYSNIKHKDLKIQHARYIERYREKEQHREIMEKGEQMRLDKQSRESEAAGGGMTELQNSEHSTDNGRNNSKKNYMDDI